ncbi:MAG: MerR family transcriptional regulator [Bacillota bacterium]|nr:MerR family transcriptional regulator [Bacillota bacterium]
MLKIGEIAGLCGTSIKALRHYNRIGLFKPEYVDPSSNYRYYGEDQIKKLNLILDLKNIGFSLKEISLVLKSGVNNELLLQMLGDKKKQSEDTIKLEEVKIENIDSIAAGIEAELKINGADQEEKPFDERLGRLVSLDSAESGGRQAIEEAIWL